MTTAESMRTKTTDELIEIVMWVAGRREYRRVCHMKPCGEDEVYGYAAEVELGRRMASCSTNVEVY